MFRIFKNEILMTALGLFVAVSCGRPGVKNSEDDMLSRRSTESDDDFGNS